MSDAPIAPAPAETTLEFECINPNCTGPKGRKMRLKAPQPEIANTTTVSMLVYPHPVGLSCNYCGQYYQIGIAGAATQVNWGIQPAERPSAIVAPPPGLRLT